jgi:hypothetical protein
MSASSALRFLSLLVATSLLAFAVPSDATIVYKWTDAEGTVHLSSEKPPPGVPYEKINVASSTSSSSRKSASGGSTTAKGSTASPAQVAKRGEVLSGLQNRECVIALETLDRLTSGTKPTSAAEIARLKQTVDLNCSHDPARRHEQEDMAAKLRVANGPECVRARNDLAEMMAPGSRTSRDQLRAQQEFVDEHCIPPVR